MQNDRALPMYFDAPDQKFMFATGIENSYPTIEWEGKTVRRDAMELSAHYQRWEEDFHLVREMGIEFLRFGPPLYRTHQGPGRYDWQWADRSLELLRKLKIHPIVDLCHFGVPDWIGGFNNDEWPAHFAHYAHAFAHRFPWVRLYTPVNEIFVAAQFSGKRGWWNERQKSDKGFVAALQNLCKANLLAQEAILRVQPLATFIQSESTSYFHQASPRAMERSYFENQRRFLALDLSYGNDVSAVMYEYLLDNGMSREEYHWFLDHGRPMQSHCIMGNDYYGDNEHLVKDDDSPSGPSGEIFGYYVLTHQYFDRYQLPIMHTETNVRDAKKAPDWLAKEWANVVRLKQDGVPIMGFTWFSLIDQTDWDTALREINFRTNDNGLFDKNRKPRAVGHAYKELIQEWRDRLPRNMLDRRLHLHETPPRGNPPRGIPKSENRNPKNPRKRSSRKHASK
ncbi:MAG TPA: family 1 glycosylhydrolase [Tepidisphaeraceae bacterium]|nr:family 1 glycosylhydrolase [Tepidisphaeraceae bacterium]